MRVLREVGGACVLQRLEQCNCLTGGHAERPKYHSYFSGPPSLGSRRLFRSQV